MASNNNRLLIGLGLVAAALWASRANAKARASSPIQLSPSTSVVAEDDTAATVSELLDSVIPQLGAMLGGKGRSDIVLEKDDVRFSLSVYPEISDFGCSVWDRRTGKLVRGCN